MFHSDSLGAVLAQLSVGCTTQKIFLDVFSDVFTTLILIVENYAFCEHPYGLKPYHYITFNAVSNLARQVYWLVVQIFFTFCRFIIFSPYFVVSSYNVLSCLSLPTPIVAWGTTSSHLSAWTFVRGV